MIIRLLALSILLIIYSGQNGFCDFWNNRNQLIGDRAAMMGGAYTALSEDGSGVFYNPAGIAFIQSTSLSLSVNMYSYQNWSRRDSGQPPNITNQIKKFNVIPTTVSLTFNLGGGFALGFSLLEIDKVKFSSIGYYSDSTTSASLNLDLDTESWLFGPTLAYQITKSFSIGVSIFFHYFQGSVAAFYEETKSGSSYIFAQQQNQITSLGLTPIFGLRWNIFNKFKIGVMYGMETIFIEGNNSSAYKFVHNGFGLDSRNTAEVKGDVRLPHRLAVGLAFEKSKKITIALDFIYYFYMKYNAPYDIFRATDPNAYHEERSHIDLSFGMEIYLSDVFALRWGAFTNTSGASEYSQSERVNSYGGTIGLGYITPIMTSGIGFIIQYGKSSINESKPNQLPKFSQILAEWKRLSIGIIMGGSIKF